MIVRATCYDDRTSTTESPSLRVETKVSVRTLGDHIEARIAPVNHYSAQPTSVEGDNDMLRGVRVLATWGNADFGRLGHGALPSQALPRVLHLAQDAGNVEHVS
eukprot:scaffold34415_cov36-Prasinocladus_malaysianus.AAC.1